MYIFYDFLDVFKLDSGMYIVLFLSIFCGFKCIIFLIKLWNVFWYVDLDRLLRYWLMVEVRVFVDL